MTASAAPAPHDDPAARRHLAALAGGGLPGDELPGDELLVGGVAARTLAERFGTPLYAFAADAITARVAAVRAALGDAVQLLWSVKANPGVAVTALLRRLGVGAEVASLGELEVALAAGHDAAALRFAGPGKTDAELDAAIARGLGCLHVEAPSELDAAARLAAARGSRVGVAIRVNLPQSLAGSRLRMGGQTARFGVDRDQVEALLRRAHADPALALRGLHVYGGTQCFDPGAFAGQAAALCAAADAWEDALGAPLAELDLGGGFGVATFCGDPELDLAATGSALRDVLAAHARPHRRHFVELGRYLTAAAGVYLTRVVRRKTSGGVTVLTLDGGLHHAAIGAGLGSIVRRPPLLVHATALRARAAGVVAVGGPLCTPQDQFAAAVALPECREGDLLAVLATGAYGLTFSPVRFLSHAEPAEVLVEAGRARVVRDRGAPTDALARQRP